MKKILLLAFIFLAAITAQAQTIFQVTNMNDAGPGSLRQAITDGNTLSSAYKINFNLSSASITLNLLSPLPVMKYNSQTSSTNAITSFTISAQSPSAAQSSGWSYIEMNGVEATLTSAYTTVTTTTVGTTTTYTYNSVAITYTNFTSVTRVVTNKLGIVTSGSLPEAILLSTQRKVGIQDKITFNIPGAAPHVIDLSNTPYIITGITSIDGSTQPLNGGGLSGNTPHIEIKGTNSLSVNPYSTYNTYPEIAISGICFSGFTTALNIYTRAYVTNCYFYGNKTAVSISYGTGYTPSIKNCVFGINPFAGTTTASANEKAIVIGNNSNMLEIANNVILNSSVCGIDIYNSGQINITSNDIGYSFLYGSALPNKIGIRLQGSSSFNIGGYGSNYIIGNTESGIEINGCRDIRITNNYIGMQSVAQFPPLQQYGIKLSGSNDFVEIRGNTIGRNNTGIQATFGVIIYETNKIDYNGVGITNAPLAAPQITSISNTQIKGKAAPNATVAIYESVSPLGYSMQGSNYLGKVTSAADGTWSFSGTFSAQTQCRLTAHCYLYTSGSSSGFTQAYNLDFLPNAVTACNGSVIIPAVTFDSYLWSDGSTNSSLVASTSGKFWLDANFCSRNYSDTINLNFATQPAVNIGNDTTYCSYAGYTRTLNATSQTPGVTYTWKKNGVVQGNTTPTYTVSSSGTYSVEVATGLCAGKDTAVITVNAPPFIPTRSTKNKCLNEDYLYSKNAAAGTYVWSDGSTGSSMLVTQPGKYWVTGTSPLGCVATDTLIVSDIALSVELGNDTTVCSTQNLILNSNTSLTGNSYAWTYNNTALTGWYYTGNSIGANRTGKYKVTVTNGVCVKSDSLDVTIIPFKTNLINDTIACNTGSITKTMDPRGTYTWSDGSQGNTFTIASSGKYWVDARMSSTCATVDTFMVAFVNCNEIKGIVYNDLNFNNALEASDQRSKDVVMCATAGSLKYYTVTDVNGLYTFNVPDGNYVITCGMFSSQIYKPSSKNYSVTVNQNTIQTLSYDFATRVYTKDISITLSSPNRARPGSQFSTYVTVRNEGTTAQPVNFTIEADPMLTLVSSSAANTLSGTKLNFNLGNFNAGQQAVITLTWSVPLTTSIVGKTMNIVGEAILSGDLKTENNLSSNDVLITYSVDPNAISVQAQYNPATQQAYNTTRLQYKIEFQNTGTDYAEDIVIIDTLPAEVDPATIKIAEASHAYTWSISKNGIIQFVFNDIMLLDSNANEPASHGHISYFINHASSLPVGTLIENEAYIYFDINAPVKTNVAEYRITGPSSAQSISFASLPATIYNDTPYIVLNATATSGLPIGYAGTGPVRISNDTLYIQGTGAVLTGAYQQGNSQYNPAYPKFARFTVITRTQTLSFGGLSDKVTTDPPFTLNATGGASGEPVVYTIVSGPATISNGTVTLTGAGTVVVQATQAGNTYYSAATSVTQQFNVSLDVQTLSLSTITDHIATDAPFSINATAGASGEPVVYSIVSGPATINNNVITLTGAGTVVVQSSQAGNTYYSAATPVTQQFNVSLDVQTLSLGTMADHIATDAPFSINASAGASGEPVVYSIVSGPATIVNNIVTLTGAGTVVVQATQGGSNYYAAATPVTQQFNVSKAPQVITDALISDKLSNDLPFDINFTGGGSGNAVVYTIVSGPASISGNTITLTGQPGMVVVKATQAGDNIYEDAADLLVSFGVTRVTANINGTNAIMAVWPNPCTDRLNVSLKQSGNYELINAQGKVVMSGSCSTEDIMDLSSLPPGVYTLKIQSGEQMSTTPIVKQ